MMEPNITEIKIRKLVGIRIQTSLFENETSGLWRAFKPRVKEIANQKNSGFYSVQIFAPGIRWEDFLPTTRFEKWAAVEVSDYGSVPPGMEACTIPAGKYAVFVHKGPANTFANTLQYIYGVWLPNSPFHLENRPHFEIMQEDYRPDDPQAEEETWVPVGG